MLCLSDSQPDSARPKNVLGPIRAALRVARHSVSLKNVPGPIRSSRHSLVRWRLPGKCSSTDRSVHLRRRRVESIGTMFLDPSRRCSRPHQTVSNLKNVPGPIASSTSVVDALNRPKKCSWTYLAVAPPRSPNCAQPEKCSWTYPGIAPLVGHRRCIPEKCSQTYREFTPSH
jgi:hypothetical protein